MNATFRLPLGRVVCELCAFARVLPRRFQVPHSRPFARICGQSRSFVAPWQFQVSVGQSRSTSLSMRAIARIQMRNRWRLALHRERSKTWRRNHLQQTLPSPASRSLRKMRNLIIFRPNQAQMRNDKDSPHRTPPAQSRVALGRISIPSANMGAWKLMTKSSGISSSFRRLSLCFLLFVCPGGLPVRARSHCRLERAYPTPNTRFIRAAISASSRSPPPLTSLVAQPS
jgi:hypothetical protein